MLYIIAIVDAFVKGFFIFFNFLLVLRITFRLYAAVWRPGYVPSGRLPIGNYYMCANAHGVIRALRSILSEGKATRVGRKAYTDLLGDIKMQIYGNGGIHAAVKRLDNIKIKH
jgi:hypothetical protein